MRHILLKYTVNRRRCKEYYILTQIIFSFFTMLTMSAGLSRFQSDSVTNLKVLNPCPDFHNSAAGLMPQHKRRFHDKIPDSS